MLQSFSKTALFDVLITAYNIVVVFLPYNFKDISVNLIIVDALLKCCSNEDLLP